MPILAVLDIFDKPFTESDMKIRLIFLLSLLLGSSCLSCKSNTDQMVRAAKPAFFAFSACYGSIACAMRALKNYNQASTSEGKFYACLMAAASLGCVFLGIEQANQSWNILRNIIFKKKSKLF